MEHETTNVQWRRLYENRVASTSKLIDSQRREIDSLKAQLAKLKEQSRNAVNTTWRFINAYKGDNLVPIKGALISAEHHLRQIDWIFKEKEAEKSPSVGP